jgi:predicted HTH domain antitoxin
MAITFEIPPDLEENLARELGNLNQAAKESALVELYRQGRISRPELSRALDLSRYETDGLLKRHGVTEDLITPAQLDEQMTCQQQDTST